MESDDLTCVRLGRCFKRMSGLYPSSCESLQQPTQRTCSPADKLSQNFFCFLVVVFFNQGCICVCVTPVGTQSYKSCWKSVLQLRYKLAINQNPLNALNEILKLQSKSLETNAISQINFKFRELFSVTIFVPVKCTVLTKQKPQEIVWVCAIFPVHVS